MKRRIGISLYPNHSDFKEDGDYLRLAAKYGFSKVFMSMLEVSEGKSVVTQKFKKIIQLARDLSFEVVLDIAPAVFADLGISYDDLSFFADLGADGIRLDVGFDGNKEAMMTYNPQNLLIELNMSNDVAYVNNILSYQANKPFLTGCHNFYPQAGTALPFAFFVKCSQRFKDEGLRTAAFITSQVGKIGPWDVNDGLPTLEMHRNLPLEVQAKHLFATNLIDDVLIGNAYASEAELQRLGNVNAYQTIFQIEFVKGATATERQIVLDEQHFRRGDISEQVIRSTEVRKKYQEFPNQAHDNQLVFQRGDIVIGNDAFGKYKNELQLVLMPHQDERKNLVGRIQAEEMILLDFIQPWTKFRFEEG